MRPSHEQVPVQPRAQVLELVNDLINHEERALHSLIDYSEKGMAVVRYLFSPWYPGTSEPRQPKAGGRVLQWRTPRGRSATAKAA
jgi:hypothetical protein